MTCYVGNHYYHWLLIQQWRKAGWTPRQAQLGIAMTECLAQQNHFMMVDKYSKVHDCTCSPSWRRT